MTDVIPHAPDERKYEHVKQASACDETMVYAVIVCTERSQLIYVVWSLENFHKGRNSHQYKSLVI
jgi:hypothetical protein